MNKTQSTEYIVGTKDGDTRWFESRARARDFIEKNREQVDRMVEKRVWDHTVPGRFEQEIDEQKTELITVEKFMRPRTK